MSAIKYCLFFLSLLLISLNLDAQTEKQRQELKTLTGQFRQEFAAEKAAAILLAGSIGIPVRQELADGRVIELMRFYRGRPIYYIIGNAGGAELINGDNVYPGGTAGKTKTWLASGCLTRRENCITHTPH